MAVRQDVFSSIDFGNWVPGDVDMDFGELLEHTPVDDTFVQSYLDQLSGQPDERQTPQGGSLFMQLGDIPSPALIDHLKSGDGGQFASSHSGSASDKVPQQVYAPGEEGTTNQLPNDLLDDARYSMGTSHGRTSVQRQQNNRRAQQRYREKRKQQHAELEEQVAQLNGKLGSFKEVEATATRLGGENEALRVQVQQQNKLIDKLQADMKILMVANNNSAQSGLGVGREATSGVSAALAPIARGDSLEQSCNRLSELIEKTKSVLLDALLPTNMVLTDDPRYDDPVLTGALAKLVAEMSIQALAMLSNGKKSCPKASVHNTSTDHFSRMFDCKVFQATWIGWLDCIHLTESQEDALLVMRADLLTCMREVYSERQRINLIAMGMMLPRPEQDPTVEGRMKCMEMKSAYFNCTIHDGKALDDILDSLKLNLKAEQKLLMEMQYNFINRVLKPVQAAILILVVHPWNIETLAIANLLAHQRGITQIPECSATKSADSDNSQNNCSHSSVVPSVAMSVLQNGGSA